MNEALQTILGVLTGIVLSIPVSLGLFLLVARMPNPFRNHRARAIHYAEPAAETPWTVAQAGARVKLLAAPKPQGQGELSDAN